MDKRAALAALAKRRQATKWKGYGCLADYDNEAYECEFVSPYTRGAANVDAEVMVILQDWSSHDHLSGGLDIHLKEHGRSPHYPTNETLERLLRETFGLELEDTYATNLFSLIKPGGASTLIPRADLVRAAREFALPQIRIVQPRLVICLGYAAFDALREASGLARVRGLDAAIRSPFSLEGAAVWCQAHTGIFGQLNRRRGDAGRVQEDWRRMKESVRGSVKRGDAAV